MRLTLGIEKFRRIRGLAAAASVLCSSTLCAHDFWIEPSTFSAQPGQSVGVRFRVGEHLVGDPLPLIPALVRQFVVQDASERKPVAGRIGGESAAVLNVGKPGLLVVGFLSHPSWLELPAHKFNAYLMEEGLDSIIALRAQRQQTGANAREIYSRCAKSLVWAGQPGKAMGDQRLGFPLELVAEHNPYQLGAGQELPIRLIYEDKPVEGALVMALNSRNPAEKQTARTDSDGLVRFRLRPGGMWLVKAVHMVAAPVGANAEWASYWASLTFETQTANTGEKSPQT